MIKIPSINRKWFVIISVVSLVVIITGTTIALVFYYRSRTDKIDRTPAGEVLITHVNTEGVGNIAVRVAVPLIPRYSDGAPVVVVASTWFVEKYNKELVGFHLEHDPTEVGAIFVANLWPGKRDPVTNASSEGVYDYGGPNSLAALRDTILFAAGEKTNVDGYYIDELLEVNPLTENLGLYASSHAGVVATNVLAYYGEELSMVKYFVGRENPTRDEMYPLEIGHFDDARKPIFNPYYDAVGYTPTTISVNYTQLGWIENAEYPEGMPCFYVLGSDDYILSGKGPVIEGKRFFSRALTQALDDNGVFTNSSWPNDLGTPPETAGFWPSRITVNNYPAIKEHLPNLKVMLVFARDDHVQAAPDKPHIRQAYDGFHETADLWVRLNADSAYFQALDSSLNESYPENEANDAPNDWMNARAWGYIAHYGTPLFSKTGSYAGIAEMADRTRANDWSDNLDDVLFEYNLFVM